MRWIAWMGLLAACEPMPATGDPLAPVKAPAPAGVQASGPKTPAPATPSSTSDDEFRRSSDGAGEFDFGEDEGTDAPETEVPDDPATLLALAQGKPPPDPSRVAPVPAPAPAVAGLPVGPAASGIGALPWDPATAPALDWGVHLVSTLVDTQPPMAVLGLPDGNKLVVQPGSFLPEHRLVVLAIGRDVAQIARVIPEGYSSRIETRTISSLFPGAAARPSVTP